MGQQLEGGSHVVNHVTIAVDYGMAKLNTVVASKNKSKIKIKKKMHKNRRMQKYSQISMNSIDFPYLKSRIVIVRVKKLICYITQQHFGNF